MDTIITLDTGILLSVIGAAMAAVFGGLGSSIGVYMAGTKAAGVLAERSDLFGKLLVITALPGSQGVYGLLIAILTLAKIGLFEGGVASVPALEGAKMLSAGVLMGACGLFSAWLQGKVAAAGIGAVARDEGVSGKAIVLSVIIETYAIFGLLVAILIINSVQL